VNTEGLAGLAEESQGIEHEDELVVLPDTKTISNGIDGRGKIVNALHVGRDDVPADLSGRLGQNRVKAG
jgi:hypothetical protein